MTITKRLQRKAGLAELMSIDIHFLKALLPYHLIITLSHLIYLFKFALLIKN